MKAVLLIFILLAFCASAVHACAQTAAVIPAPFSPVKYDVFILDAGQGALVKVTMPHKLAWLLSRHPIGSLC